MSELPKGWTSVPIGELGEWRGGGTPSKARSEFWTDGTVPWVSAKDMKRDYIAEVEDYITENAIKGSATQLIDAKSVLVVTRSGILRHSLPVAVNTVPVTINQDLKALTPFSGFEADFILRQLQADAQIILADCMKTGTTVESVHFERFKARDFRIAPLLEQRRIVAKVDGLTARTARARKELDRIPTLIARYKQRLLVLAFSGELTAGWREKSKVLPETHTLSGLTSELDGLEFSTSWTSGTLSELAENHDGKRRPIKAADRSLRHGDFRYYGASGVIDTIDDYLFDGDYLLIGEDGANLISRSTPIAFLASGQFWVNNHAHILRAKPVTSNSYLCWFINMINLTPYVTGSAQPKLTQANLNKIRAPLPPIEEQAEIVRRIESAFGWLDRMAADHAAAARLLPKLDAAILAKAFRGELVPQDPNDEPASVLLERIKAEREAAPKKTRGRQPTVTNISGKTSIKFTATGTLTDAPKKSGVKSMTKSRQDDDVKDKPYLAGLLKSASLSDVQSLFRAADLPVADFYKQLAWEISAKHIIDDPEELKAA